MNYKDRKELVKYILADHKLLQVILSLLIKKEDAIKIIEKIIQETDKEVEDLGNGKKAN